MNAEEKESNDVITMYAKVTYLDINKDMWLGCTGFEWITKSIEDKLLIGEDTVYKTFAHTYLIKFGLRCIHISDGVCKNRITNHLMKLCTYHTKKRHNTTKIINTTLINTNITPLTHIIIDYLYTHNNSHKNY